MKDSREFLRSLGLAAVKAIAGLFALSWVGIVLFPMTTTGLIVLIFSLIWLVYLYRRNLTVRKTIAALIVSGLAVFTGNVVAISRFGGPVYIYSCSALAVSCARVTETQAYKRPILIVPIWTPKTQLFKYLLSDHDKVYFPALLRTGERTILHAPFEEQALRQAGPAGIQNMPGYGLSVHLPVSELSLTPGEAPDKMEIGFAVKTTLVEGIHFDSALSNTVPGQFSITSHGDPGPEEWRRLAFSNETVRALMIDQAAAVVEELGKEARRTGLLDDYVRYATISLALNKGFYPNLPGASQRLFELRTAIHTVDAYGDFHIAADLPWNRAFIMAALDTLQDLHHLATSAAPARVRRLSQDTTLTVQASPVPWKQEWEWISDKGRSIWARADPEDRFGKAMMASFFDGSFTKMDDFFAKWDDLAPPDREELRARAIFERGKAFEHFLAQWLAEAPQMKPRRIAAMSRIIFISTMREAMSALSGGWQGLNADRPDERMDLLKKIQNARAILASNETKMRLLAKYAVTEFQRIQLAEEDMSFDSLFEFFEQAVVCGPAEQDCQRAYVKLTEAWMDRMKTSPLALKMLLSSAADQDPSGRRLATQLIRLMTDIAPPMTVEEFDQGVAPVLMLALMPEDPALRGFLPRICTAADRYSSRLLSEPDSDQRIFLHESAILLATACNRPWSERHRMVLSRNGLDPGLWVTLIQERRAQERPGRA